MRYKDSINEVILIERERGRTYKEIAEKLNVSIYKVKKVVYGNKESYKRRDKPERKGKNSKSDLDT
jgi:predicted nuclease of restriction endonuclease-like RecB superfamily